MNILDSDASVNGGRAGSMNNGFSRKSDRVDWPGKAAVGIAAFRVTPEKPGDRLLKLEMLTRKERRILRALMEPGDDEDCFVRIGNAEITRGDFRLFRGVTWLNDECINAYAFLINAKSMRQYRASSMAGSQRKTPVAYTFSSFFYEKLALCKQDAKTEQRCSNKSMSALEKSQLPYVYSYRNVRRWTRHLPLNVWDYDLVLIPINIGQWHWVLISLDLTFREIAWMDSMHGAPRPEIIANVRRWGRDELADKSSHNKAASIGIPITEWPVQVNKYRKRSAFSMNAMVTNAAYNDVPKQNDSGSCGVFTMKLAECLACGIDTYYTNNDMRIVRDRMALDLYNGVLPNDLADVGSS